MNMMQYLRVGRAATAAAILIALAGVAHAESMTFVMEPLAPFTFDEKGVAQGPFPDIVREVCESMKIQCTLEVYPWRRAFAMAQSGLVEGILVFLRTPEREQDFYFTDPVLQTSFALFVSRSSGLV